MGRSLRINIVWMIVALLAGATRGQTTIDVEFGWGNYMRAGAWTPVFATLSDPRSRNVMLEMHAPASSGDAMTIRQHMTIGPEPATFALLAPLTYSLDQTTLDVRDADTNRTLATAAFADPFNEQPRNRQVIQSSDVLIGVSGRRAGMQALDQQNFGQRTLSIGYLAASRLPAVAEGYTSLDVLALNQPNLDPSGASTMSLRLEQQQAIIDWVRAGGNLVLWFGTDPIPSSSPIVNALPCAVGDVQLLAASPDLLKRAGLGARFAQLQHRPLTPFDGAQTFALLGDSGALAYHRQVGFGTITVLSMDASLLQFNDAAASLDFWTPVLDRLIDKIDEQATTQPYYYQNTIEQRHAAAVQATMDLLGDVPGVGSFGFSYVAIVLIGLMLVVGPVDWFVLKKLNRQPWTWATTTGWIALVTCGALYVGHVFKSGDLHLRTLRLIDQADGQTVANIDFIGIYSPRTTNYELKVDEQTWFRPPDMGQYYYSGRLGAETAFRQDFRGNRPEKMRINVWNLKFIQGEKIEAGPAVIEAKLHVSGIRLRGTITNRSVRPMKNFAIQCQLGMTMIGEVLNAGQTIGVDGLIVAARPDTYSGPEGHFPFVELNYPNYGVLAPRRHLGAVQAIESGRFACVYAETVDAASAAVLSTPGAIEQHRQIIRALIPLEAGK